MLRHHSDDYARVCLEQQWHSYLAAYTTLLPNSVASTAMPAYSHDGLLSFLARWVVADDQVSITFIRLIYDAH